MTEKEKLIEFVQANVDEHNKLLTVEELTNENDGGRRRFMMSKEKTIERIKEWFTDDLVGKPDGDKEIRIIEYKTIKENE